MSKAIHPISMTAIITALPNLQLNHEMLSLWFPYMLQGRRQIKTQQHQMYICKNSIFFLSYPLKIKYPYDNKTMHWKQPYHMPKETYIALATKAHKIIIEIYVFEVIPSKLNKIVSW